MCPKEESEILTIKKACLVSVDVFTKYLKDQIMEIIDSDKVFHYISYILKYPFVYILINLNVPESQTFKTSRRCGYSYNK